MAPPSVVFGVRFSTIKSHTNSFRSWSFRSYEQPTHNIIWVLTFSTAFATDSGIWIFSFFCISQPVQQIYFIIESLLPIIRPLTHMNKPYPFMFMYLKREKKYSASVITLSLDSIFSFNSLVFFYFSWTIVMLWIEWAWAYASTKSSSTSPSSVSHTQTEWLLSALKDKPKPFEMRVSVFRGLCEC